MLHFNDIPHATLEQLTAELAAAGCDSTQTDLIDAREAMVRLHYSLHTLSLCDSDTNEILRPATVEEAIESINAGDEGHIMVDGRRVYVEL